MIALIPKMDKMANRKQRIDTTTAAVDVFKKAFQDLAPPSTIKLGEAEKFWLNVLAMKPKSEWTPHNLEIAAMLTKAMYRLDDNTDKLIAEGEVLATDKGSLMANPRVAIVHGLHSQIKGWRQTLGIHDRGVNGEKRDADKRRAHTMEIEKPIDDLDDLIARPN